MFSKVWKKLSGNSNAETQKQPEVAESSNDVQEAANLEAPDSELIAQINQLDARVVSLYQSGQFAEAIEDATLSADLTRQLLGEQHPDYFTGLNNLAELHRLTGDYAAAERLHKQALELRRTVLGEQHPHFAISLNNLGMVYDDMGYYALAEPLYKQATEIERSILGEQDPEFAKSLNNLAVLNFTMGNYAAAEPLFKQALEIKRNALGEQHESFAISLDTLGELYRLTGNYTAAEPLFKQALEIKRTTLGEQHPEFTTSLYHLADLYESMGNNAAAEQFYKQVLELRRAMYGEQHPKFVQSLYRMASLYKTKGDYAATESIYKQVMGIRRAAVGEQHPEFAQSLSYLALLYESMGDYAAAQQFHKQALEIYRSAHGEQHPDIATCLNNLAELYHSMGDFASAEQLYKQALEIKRTALGEQHPEFAAGLSNLALLYESMGDYAACDPLYKQALEIYRTTLGERHPDFATSLNNLAKLHYAIGDYAAAEPLFKQALEIRRTTRGERHPDVAQSLNNLAALYEEIRNYAAAEPLYKQALEIRRAALGERHSLFALTLNNLAMLYDNTGNHAAALPLYKQALEIRRAALGEQHPLFAQCLNNLGVLYDGTGDFAAAEPLYKQAVEIYRATLGEQHPEFAVGLNNLAGLYAATKRETAALKLMEQVLAIDDRMIGQVFSISSEQQRTAYLKTIREHFERLLSLVSQYLSNSPKAVRSALSVVLRRKAIEAETLATQRDAVLSGKYPEAAPKLREIMALRAQIAQKTLAGPSQEGLQAHLQLLAQWNAQKEKLETEVARQVPEMNIEQKLRSIDHQVVAMAMPAGAALVEFVRFNVFDFKAVPSRNEPQYKPARYLAFVMPAGEPENVAMVDLGEAEPIDRMIATFREMITGEEEDRSKRGLGALPASARRSTSKGPGIELREAIFTPLLKAIGNRKRLMISPDGDLTRLPFEVLPTDDGRRLIDEYRTSYLSAGRDVVRFELKSNRNAARSLVAADPDFDFGAKAIPAAAAAGAGRRSQDFKRDATTAFNRLPGTRLEGENIAMMLDAELWTEGAALDARLKKCQSPRVLHLSTHGFFLEDQKRNPNEERLGLGATSFSESGMERLANSRFENPLLRSGLALAGVNTWLEKGELMEDAEDGLLTAEDVSGLDLLDTELVVLSACETGLGEVRVGEGVFGLRRAFVLAGAKTLVMSLWKVPDEQTRELMENFYRRILSGEPRAEALREAQLAMKAKHPEPIYWGAFICQGNPGPLSRQT